MAADDQTFRPTVVIRRANVQGSGTLVASVDGEALILTVAHVAQGAGELTVEMHRYNLGLEHRPSPWKWPRVLPAEILAADAASDLAVVRVRRLPPLPFVARLGEDDQNLVPGSVVTSIGIDKGANLASWSAHVLGVVQLDPNNHGAERPYLITDHAPEHGRSGGGLFLPDGTLVGVCIGRVDRRKGVPVGVFGTLPTVRKLLHDHRLDEAIAISNNRHFAAKPSAPRRTRVTPTENRQPARGR